MVCLHLQLDLREERKENLSDLKEHPWMTAGGDQDF